MFFGKYSSNRRNTKFKLRIDFENDWYSGLLLVLKNKNGSEFKNRKTLLYGFVMNYNYILLKFDKK